MQYRQDQWRIQACRLRATFAPSLLPPPFPFPSLSPPFFFLSLSLSLPLSFIQIQLGGLGQDMSSLTFYFFKTI